MLFGWRVLVSLRDKPEPKPGFDTAIMGALPWLLFVVFVMTGGVLWATLDAAGITPPTPQIFDKHFDQEWALAIIDRGLKAVQSEFAEACKHDNAAAAAYWLAKSAEVNTRRH